MRKPTTAPTKEPTMTKLANGFRQFDVVFKGDVKGTVEGVSGGRVRVCWGDILNGATSESWEHADCLASHPLTLPKEETLDEAYHRRNKELEEGRDE